MCGTVHRWSIISMVACLALGASDVVVAALGAPLPLAPVSNLRMVARSMVDAKPGHSVHKSVMPDGSQVQEFVSNGGVVFAVSWRTLYKPNLLNLLGTSYPTYVSAARHASERPGIQRHFKYEGPDLVIKSRSHLNVFTGLAYRRSLLPPGITADQIE
jgi:hypothetical protein